MGLEQPKGSLYLYKVPSCLGRITGCVLEAHDPRFDFYWRLNVLNHPVSVVVGVVNTPSFGSLEGSSIIKYILFNSSVLIAISFMLRYVYCFDC